MEVAITRKTRRSGTQEVRNPRVLNNNDYNRRCTVKRCAAQSTYRMLHVTRHQGHNGINKIYPLRQVIVSPHHLMPIVPFHGIA